MKRVLILSTILFVGGAIMGSSMTAYAGPDDVGAKSTAIEEALVLNPFVQDAYFKNEEETVTIINILKELGSGANHQAALPDAGVRGIGADQDSEKDGLEKLLSTNPLLRAAYENNAERRGKQSSG